MPRLSRITTLLCLLFLAAGTLGCKQGKPKPVDIVWNEDSCVECRMAVSDRKFGCEIVSADGTSQAFDDIGCMVLWVGKNGIPVGGAAYVLDFNGAGWIDAQQSQYLLAKGMPTPMSYGIGAFTSAETAQMASKQWPGSVLTWDALLKEFKP
jgi:copper chaperone NosL